MHAYLHTLKQYYKTHTTRSRVILSILALIVLLAISRILLPYAIIYSSVSWLNDQGVTASIEDISIDVLNGSVILKNATGKDANNHSFVIGDIELFWDWSPLSDKTVQIIKIKLHNIKFDIEQYRDLMVVSGIKIQPSKDADVNVDETSDDSTPWGTALHTIELSNISLCYQQHSTDYSAASADTRDIDYCLKLDEMTWQGQLSHTLSSQIDDSKNTAQLRYQSNGDFHLNNFVITDNILAKSLVDIEEFNLKSVVINSLNDISLASVVLKNISSLQRDDKEHIDSLRIKELTINDIKYQNLNQLNIASIDIENPGIFLEKDESGRWEYQQWIPELGATAEANTQVKTSANSQINSEANSKEKNKTKNKTTIVAAKEGGSTVAIPSTNTIEKTEKTPVNFKAKLGAVNIHNSDFCYDDKLNKLYTCFNQDLLSWTGEATFAGSGKPELKVKGNLQLQQTRLQNQISKKHIIDLQSLAINNLAIQSLDDISIASINFEKLHGLQRIATGKKNIASINKLSMNNINLSDMKRLSVKDITLDTPDLLLSKDKNGHWEFDSLLPKFTSQAGKDKTTKTAEAQTSSSFVSALGNINILHPDLCYQDQAEGLHYCLRQQSTSWHGDITIDSANDIFKAKGKLLSSSTQIENIVLGRNLLKLKTLSLSQTDIQSSENISFGDIKLNSLFALQSAKKSNQYALWLDSINANKVALKGMNAVEVNKLQIIEPGLQVTKNKNKQWDYDAWLVKNNKEKVEPKGTEDKTTDTTNQAPFNIILNDFSLKSRQKIAYVDNSLTPVMHIGLKSIKLNVNDIDSTKPKQKTTFSLDAKSDRHSTIELAGYALPFAEKPSFDAKGNLLGLDLRAVSPAAEEAIGHYIKSGQMDAELTLLAEDGILDSNIALVLNQFNLEPVSKEDASALDETFGMPVNQSLSLLRDKDDSIHLDLPITGDINNPEFDPTNAIIKATTKATTVALITFYTPYGLIYAGGNVLFDLATAMDFPSVVFAPGISKLNSENIKQLESLTTMLNEKPQLHLTFCGMTNSKDRLALFPLPAKENTKDTSQTKENQKAEPVILPKLTKEQRLKLETLADERQKNTKEYLVEKSKIKHNRLILCAPSYNKENDAISGVEISL